jgi:hypothetical protein
MAALAAALTPQPQSTTDLAALGRLDDGRWVG